MAVKTLPLYPPPESAAPNPRQQLQGLVRQLSEAGAALHALLGGQVDTIIDPLTGTPILLQEAQQALLRSEARYRALANILENVQEAIVVTDLAGVATYWNVEAAALFGYAQAGRLGVSLDALYPNPAELRAQLRELAAGLEARAEWQARRADGATVWVALRATPMRGEAGEIVGGLYVFKDISGRKQAEESARNTARRFQALIENSADAISLLAADGTVLYSSSAITRSTGGVPSDWVGGNFLNRVHPEDAPRLRGLLAELLQSPNASVSASFRFRRFDESWGWLEGASTNLLHDPAVGAIVANFRDITDRKLAEEALRREHDLGDRIRATSPVSITLVNRHGQIVYANPRAVQVLNLSQPTPDQAAYDQPAWRVSDFDGRPFPEADLPFQRVMAGGQPVNDVRHAIEWPDGRRLLLSVNAAPVFTADAQIDGIVFAYEDITERVQAEQALRSKKDELAAMTQQLWHAAKLATLGELAASIAHELNNPLATISLRVETMLTRLPAGAPERSPLSVIEAEVERMARMVAELLAFGRRNQPQISTLNLSAEIDRALEFVDHHLQQRKIHVTRAYAPEARMVQADRQLLRQVFLNLLTNASDAMGQGGEFTIRVANGRLDDADALVVDFADTGQGIAPEQMAEIWEPFYTTKPEGQGTGLGLAICRRIVQEHGGTISMQSTLGQGTLVRLVLPLTVKAIERPAAEAGSAA